MAYTKKTWQDNEVITKDGLNNIENGIKGIDDRAAEKIDAIGMANAGTIGSTFNQTEVQKIASLTDKNKEIINKILENLKAVGLMRNE